MTRRTRILLAAAALAGALGAACAPRVREWFAVDACLDGGGCWNRAARRCEHAQEKCSQRAAPR